MERQKLKIIVIVNYVLIALLGVSSVLLQFLIKTEGIRISIIFVLFIVTILSRIWEEKVRDKILGDSKVEKMELLLKYLYNYLNFTEDESVSITIHKKIDDNFYERFTRTLRHNAMKDDKGQRFQITQGIVGLALRTQGEDVFNATFKDDTDKYVKLIDAYHYSEEQANKMLEDKRKSYYCRTIVHNEIIWGALFMTSSNHKIFLNRENKLKKNIDNNIKQIIEFIQNDVL